MVLKTAEMSLLQTIIRQEGHHSLIQRIGKRERDEVEEIIVGKSNRWSSFQPNPINPKSGGYRRLDKI